MAKKKDPRLARAGVSGFNKPKRTPSHPKKSHIVVAKEGKMSAAYWANRVKWSPSKTKSPSKKWKKGS